MEKRESNELRPSSPSKDYIFGTRAVIEAIRSGKEVDRLFVQKGISNELTSELLDLAKSLNLSVVRAPVEKLNRITRKNHQGAICFLSPINFASLDNIIDQCFGHAKLPLLIILDRITDVRNFGALARTAECAGVDAIIVPDRGSARIGSDAMKTSAGALNFIPICRESNLKKTISFLKNSGIQVIACTEKSENYFYETDFTAPTAILMGSEEDGISPEYLKMADHSAKIPQLGKIASLNVSVAASLIMYEAVRQRQFVK